MTAVLAALLASGVVLAWPPAHRTRFAWRLVDQAAAWSGRLAPDRAPPAQSRSSPPAGRRLRWRRRRLRTAAIAEALAVLDAIGPALRAGLSPSAALAHLARVGVGSGGLVADLAAASLEPALGADPRTRASPVGADPRTRVSPVGDIWSHLARTTGADELNIVAAAWSLTDTAGVALAEAVDLAARLVRDARARSARLEVLLAGPRATMLLLTLLPIAGPVVGALVGIDPLTLYAGSPLAVAALGFGLALLVLGRLWCRVLLRRARSATATPGA